MHIKGHGVLFVCFLIAKLSKKLKLQPVLLNVEISCLCFSHFVLNVFSELDM